MALPDIPATHKWIDGGAVIRYVGTSGVTGPGNNATMFCWDRDAATGSDRVTDLYDQDGNPCTEIPVRDNTFVCAVPKTVAKPVFSVGQTGPRFAGNDWDQLDQVAAHVMGDDGVLHALDADPASAFRVGLDARLNSTFARLGSLASTAVQYVSTAGNDSAAGTSWGAAKATVGAAVAAIASTGGRVLVGPGTYPLAASLALAPRADQTGIEVVGAGAQLTILTYAGADAAVIIGDGSATDCRRTYLRHLSIVGTSAGLAGVRFNSTRFCGLDNVEISGFTIPGGASVRMLADVANYFNVLKECKFNGSTYGVRLDGGTGVGANSNYIRNCHFSTHASDGLLIDAGDSNRVEDCEFNGGTATGVRLVNNAVGNVIMGNQFDGTTTMWNVATSAVTDSMFLANTGSGTVLDSGTRTVRVDTTAVSIFGWRVGTDGKTYAAPGSDTATGATAGSATLPAAPAGFFSMRKSDGTQVKVPYYGF